MANDRADVFNVAGIVFINSARRGDDRYKNLTFVVSLVWSPLSSLISSPGRRWRRYLAVALHVPLLSAIAVSHISRR